MPSVIHFVSRRLAILASVALPIVILAGSASAQAMQASVESLRMTVLSTPITDEKGNTWDAADGFDGGGVWSGPDAATDIVGTTDDALYRPERFGMISWRSPLIRPGTYNVTLKMREAYWNSSGIRVFSVAAENSPQLTDVDIYKTVGNNHAYDHSFKVTVDDGYLNLSFSAKADSAVLSAIQIQREGAAEAPQNSFSYRMTSLHRDFTDEMRHVWNARNGFNGGRLELVKPGTDIAQTVEDGLYRPAYIGMKSWRLSVPKGKYDVILKMREAYWSASNQRVFSVKAEGHQMLQDVDIFARVGKNTALDATFTVTVEDQALDLEFSASKDIALVSAIEIKTAASSEVSSSPYSFSELVAPDGGGTSYYKKFSDSLPSDDSFFPIGVWLEGVSDPKDVSADRAAGLNTYVGLATNSDVHMAKNGGMNALPYYQATLQAGGVDAAAGWFIEDEVDMWAGAGDTAWTGNAPGAGPICDPENATCGYTVLKTITEGLPKDGRVRAANFGKGVLFWQSKAQGGRFVNDYADIVSADAYWFTDGNICGTWEGGQFLFPSAPRPLTEAECRRPSNYGRVVDKIRSLVSPGGSKPVWAFVELGHPFGQSEWPTATESQVEAGIWSSIIHGARGIIYFNHSFGGNCISQHILRDSCYASMRRAVTALNAQITALAPVLNADELPGVVRNAPSLDTLTKVHGNDVYIFSQSTADVSKRMTMELRCGGGVPGEVVGENRKVAVLDGKLGDYFTLTSPTHIYRFPGAASQCLTS